MALAGTLGCGPRQGFVRYEPAPLATPDQRTAQFTARTLSDPRLDTLLRLAGATTRAASGSAPDPRWTPRALGVAAVYFNPEIDTARAGLGERTAAVVTARQRPQPGVTASTAIGGAAATFTEALTATFTIETGGKRDARTGSARAALLATGLRVRALAWRVAFDAQDAATRAWAAELILADARTERTLLATVRDLLRARYGQGSASASELARTESDLQSAAVAVVDAERGQANLRDSLARALGVPVAVARAIRLGARAGETENSGYAGDAATCVALDSLAPADLQRTALQRRFDLGATIGDYAVAEHDLRLQVARQYPDLAVGPGITFGPGAVGWIIGAGLPNLMLNRNRGPIAEAQARRVSAARRVEQMQQQVLREIAAARVECDGANGQLAAADSLGRAAAAALRLRTAAYDRGETGRTEVALARLTEFRAARVRRAAEARASLAGVLLERAVGGWLSSTTLPDAAILEEHRPEPPARTPRSSPPPGMR